MLLVKIWRGVHMELLPQGLNQHNSNQIKYCTCMRLLKIDTHRDLLTRRDGCMYRLRKKKKKRI